MNEVSYLEALANCSRYLEACVRQIEDQMSTMKPLLGT